MKRHHLSRLSVILALAVLVQAGCQEQAGTPASSALRADRDTAKTTREAAQSAPRIAFDRTVYDFGEVSSNRKYTGQFQVTNTGSGVLTISDVKRCCGVTVSLDKRELAPAESGILKFEYSTDGSPGLRSRPLRVLSNDETHPDVTLTVNARIVPKVDYRPSKIDLVLDKENAGCPQITITSLDQQPFAIQGFQSTGEVITAKVDPSVEATRFVLRPQVDLKKLERYSGGTIAITLTHPELDRVTIYFVKTRRFEVKPNAVFLLHPRPQEPTINKIAVVSNYGEHFEIESTSSEKGIAKVLSQRASDGGYQLEVQVIPPPPNAARALTEVLNIRLKSGEELSQKYYICYPEAVN